MPAWHLILFAILGAAAISLAMPVVAQDADLCLITAERVSAGEKLAEDEKKEAHEACLRALSDTASVLQKYQFQEADFEIMGTRPKN